MIAHRRVKMSKQRAQLVGVIGSRRDFELALRIKNPPDLFELRLDRLVGCLKDIEAKMSILPAPIIVTARHPAEGGANQLSNAERRALLERFAPHARYIDVELRSINIHRSLLDFARRKKIGCIISVHDLKDTPAIPVLKRKARAARSAGADIFKVVTRTDAPIQLGRLIDFTATCDVDLALSVMGIGKLGALSRPLFVWLGSALNYAAVGEPVIEGQLSIKQLRATLSGLKLK
jgi:3-dehydroquinate dehydratase-1